MKYAIIGISIVIVAIAAYAIFGRTTTQTSGGGTQESHAGVLGWVKGVLNGLHLSIAG